MYTNSSFIGRAPNPTDSFIMNTVVIYHDYTSISAERPKSTKSSTTPTSARAIIIPWASWKLEAKVHVRAIPHGRMRRDGDSTSAILTRSWCSNVT